ncbi:class I adenylate-forming enzyme family protein [Clostridium magnum]|uniref:Long-chain-fatty-acid--CoA ligase n=1 Tax=Clostridium magnum DSM 2767 TaxID=1121326 RepID=A0A162RNC6_9CLOT|nr:class I adenylate-forming enzyme family protein [Clostridium magnum]KZL90160.1 long-chain-fatty-acid--CoA ligase [Clostridium magnum DSM 2767]SHH62736.1 long-chain acyl-CoA synthetase [Clostridium magnum DSM 2767]
MVNGNDFWPHELIADMTKRKVKDKIINTYPDLPNNLYDVLKKSAYNCSDKIAIIDNYNREYSYCRLLELVDQFSSYLHNIVGVKHGKHVALMLYNSIEFCVAFLALCKIGAVTIPLPSKYKKSEIRSLADKSDLNYIICDEDFYNWFIPYKNQGICIIKSTNAENGYGFSNISINHLPWTDSAGGYEDSSIIMFTSGTTSQSKGVVIKNYNIMHAIVSYQRVLGITCNDKTIIATPIYHITGLIALLGLFLYSKGTIYLHKFFDAQRVLKCAKENNITFIHAAPAVFLLLLEQAENFPKIPSLKSFAYGSSNMPKEKLKQLHKWLPNVHFHTVYGLTETTSPATIFSNNAATSEFIGSSGKPIPGTEFKIIDEDDREVSNNFVGEILIRGTVVLDNYYNLVSSSLDEDGWLRTGDLGYFNDQGYLYVVDRKKDMINRGGEKIWSYDIENEIYKISGVDEAAVVGIPNEVYGEVAAAAVKLTYNCMLTEDEIKQHLLEKLAKYKIPQRILILNDIPKTANGKVDKKAIRNLFKQEENIC